MPLLTLIRKFVDAKINNLSCVEVWGTGKVFREFMHVDDVARAAIFFMKNSIDRNLINIGWGKEISIIELVEMLKKRSKFNGDIIWEMSKKDVTVHKKLDVNNMKKYGFSPTITLEKGIDLTIQSYCNEYFNKSFELLVK